MNSFKDLFEFNEYHIKKDFIKNDNGKDVIQFYIYKEFEDGYIDLYSANSLSEGYEYCVAKIQDLMNKEIINLEEQIVDLASDF